MRNLIAACFHNYITWHTFEWLNGLRRWFFAICFFFLFFLYHWHIISSMLLAEIWVWIPMEEVTCRLLYALFGLRTDPFFQIFQLYNRKLKNRKKNCLIGEDSPAENMEIIQHGLLKMKNENCTILIPKGNSYCRRKSSARGPQFKVSSESQIWTCNLPVTSPTLYQLSFHCSRTIQSWLYVWIWYNS